MNINLKLALIQSGQTQFEIAHQVGISETRLSRLVRGRLPPSEEEAKRIARILRVSPTQLFPELDRNRAE